MVYNIKLQGSFISRVEGGDFRWDGCWPQKYQAQKWALGKGRRRKKNPQIIEIMCSMGFKHTHIQTS